MHHQVEVLTISDPAMLKVIADPVRLSLLREFAEPRTIGEAAQRIGFEGKGVYRHVDQLLSAGLLHVVSTRQKRGTIERTLQASAKRIVAVVSQGGPGGPQTIAPPDKILGQMEASARIDLADWQDFEAAVADLLREYESDSGAPIKVRLTASKA